MGAGIHIFTLIDVNIVFLLCLYVHFYHFNAASSLPVEEKLSEEMRMELSKLLDPVNTGKDVFALASRLGYDSLVSALEVMGCSGSSPTHFLLDYNEVNVSACK